jgi:hypothetical protein
LGKGAGIVVSAVPINAAAASSLQVVSVPAPPPPPPPPPAPPPPPTPTPPPPPPPSATPDAASDAASDPSPPASFPALAPYAAWSLVRWDMPLAEVEAALRKEGATIVEANDAKNGPKRLRATSGAWAVTIDFGASGPDEIVVTSANLSKEAADALVAKMNDRAPATKTVEHDERRWKKDTGELATLVVHVEGATATMREEHARERSPGGAVGFAGLRWGMSTQEVIGQLTARGYGAYVAKTGDSHAATVPFTKGDTEGTASFNQFGLRHVELSGPTTDGGAARAKELESALGKASSVEASRKTEHVDHARMTSIEIEARAPQPGGGFTVSERYRRKR